jgi:hypothetical protein
MNIVIFNMMRNFYLVHSATYLGRKHGRGKIMYLTT